MNRLRVRRLLGSALAGALTLASVGLTAAPSSADWAPQDPADPATPVTVTADALPTAQVDGVVWSQAVAGGRVYAGGSFATARPAGAAAGEDTVARDNLFAYDLRTGEYDASFAPRLNAQVRAVALSPDESRLYVGGDFTTVDGLTRRRIAAFDTATGALVDSFAPPVNYSVHAIVATDSTVYAGGNFQGVGSQPRNGLAAFRASDGALLDWAPAATGGYVWALAISPDSSKLVAGGNFTELDGSSAPGYGLAMLDVATGASLPFAVNNELVRNGGPDSAITSLSSDGQSVYGTGYAFGKGGTLEGTFSASWDGGAVNWVNSCHGDTYSVHPRGGAVYVAGHAHYCGNIGGFPQTEPDWSFYRAMAFGKTATGVNSREPYGSQYHNFQGRPSSSVLTWFPSLNIGSYTGQHQGPWNVAGQGDYIVMGGEFTRVNGRSQQGLVRFAAKDLAPKERGPNLFGTTYPITATSADQGRVRIHWRANHDDDNDYLTYRVYRDEQNAAGLVHARSARARFWNLQTMGFTDTGLAPGSAHRYRVAVTDPAGNIANSPWVDVVVADSGAASEYVDAVLASQPEHFWRLGEDDPAGTAADVVGFGDAAKGAGVSDGAAGATGDGDTASRFDGSGTGFAATTEAENPPDVLSLEAWFKTTSPRGGKIVGFGNRSSGSSGRFDRHVYLDDSGRVRFGVYDGAHQVVSSPAGYRDGAWHHVVATLGPDGMRLYVDGRLVGQRASATVGEHGYWGYWRIGGDSVTSWPSRPSSGYLDGEIDDVAVYKSVLTGAEVAAHHAAANLAPAAEFTATTQGLNLSVDAAASSDPDGPIASYAWDFGDGATASGVRATHGYDQDGTYPVRLTVTDEGGATGTTTRQVSVSASNRPPAAGPVTARTTAGRTVKITLAGSDPDGDALAYRFSGLGGAKLTGAGPDVQYTPKPGFAGNAAFDYTVTDGRGGEATARVTVAVAKNAATFKPVLVRPARITPAARPRLAVTVVTSLGRPAAGGVVVKEGARTVGRGTLNRYGKVTVTTSRLKVGRHRLTVRYLGNATTTAATRMVPIRVWRR